MTVVKSTNGNIFGGFVKKAWDSSSGLVEDSNAFIFSLVNKENNPFKVMCTNAPHAIDCNLYYGPIFGNDICISSDSNSNQNSISFFGHSYEHASYEYQSEKAQTILAGSKHFQTLEIEVFFVTN